jgi:hypothetical protein
MRQEIHTNFLSEYLKRRSQRNGVCACVVRISGLRQGPLVGSEHWNCSKTMSVLGPAAWGILEGHSSSLAAAATPVMRKCSVAGYGKSHERKGDLESSVEIHRHMACVMPFLALVS